MTLRGLQVHSSGDAGFVQHHPPLQEESPGDDCHRVDPGLRRLLSPSVWLQYHRSGPQYCDFVLLCRYITVMLFRLRNGRRVTKAPPYSEIQGHDIALESAVGHEMQTKWTSKAQPTNLVCQRQSTHQIYHVFVFLRP